jgi:hypothetical protein
MDLVARDALVFGYSFEDDALAIDLYGGAVLALRIRKTWNPVDRVETARLLRRWRDEATPLNVYLEPSGRIVLGPARMPVEGVG